MLVHNWQLIQSHGVNSGCDSLHSKPIVIKALPPCATKGLISLYDFSSTPFSNSKERKLLWGIVTNKPENLSYLLLEKLGVKPDVVVCGDTLEHSKPHPAPLLYA
jgi:hypothetical protein